MIRWNYPDKKPLVPFKKPKISTAPLLLIPHDAKRRRPYIMLLPPGDCLPLKRTPILKLF